MVPNFNSVKSSAAGQSDEYSDEQYGAEIDNLFRAFADSTEETLAALKNNPFNQQAAEAAHSPSDTNDSDDSDKENHGPKLVSNVAPGTLFAQPAYKEPPKTAISAAPNIPVLRRAS